MRRAVAKGLAAAAFLGSVGMTMLAQPASADVVACQYLRYGATLGCATVPAPASPAGSVAVGAGNELQPAPYGQEPTTTQTYVCVYTTSAPPTCALETLGVPVVVSVVAGTT